MVYNELVRTRPDVVCLLAKPDWPADVQKLTYRWDPNFLSERSASLFPEGKTILNFSAALIKAHTRSLLDENQPLLSTAQLDALETVVATPNKHHLKVSMQPGDLQFVNNCAILHAREPFQDDNVNKNTWFAYGSLVRTGYGDFLMTWATSDQSSSMETKTRGIGRLNLWLGRNRRFPIAHRTELFRHSPGALS
ncbi:taurine catabolism dioxygenase family protein [Drepanopeziza brunnea f. sp. 'multigermtubi' MB_m1]|uniref:Taurine catabolism dioxygenase family protein n=1 Tax=Marssonina brunnea f. sp. multigermtubi (strain MB_m1) TaxID=1072389 RepID=K1WR28_MARBU|nr:taurine catabolism dioxygenase family protein [Drepanopeziza brunnea f. sp. 'multigermtubi' MB_m1]EKD15481.1 taurine catabolism dioxygenase family protein [Drepanopeziza brunnea f. sp. 'multigermtubi' MB_m1]